MNLLNIRPLRASLMHVLSASLMHLLYVRLKCASSMYFLNIRPLSASLMHLLYVRPQNMSSKVRH